MRHKEKRRCSPTDFYSVGAERGRPRTEVRHARSFVFSQGRDCVHQSCAAVPSAYSTVVRRWLCSYSSRALVVPCVGLLAVLRLLLFGLWLGALVFCGLVCCRPSASVASRRPPGERTSVAPGSLSLVVPGHRRFPHRLCILAVFATFSELWGAR